MRSFFYAIIFLLTISTLVAGDPDHLEVVVLSENNLCDDSLPNRGAAFAKIIEDDGKEDTNLKDYTINWFVGSTTSGTPVFIGAAYDQMAAGTYTVQAIHDKSSFVDVVEVTIVTTTNGPDAYVDEIKNAKNCKENDGSAKVRVRADFPQEGPDHSHDNIKDCKHGICWNFVWYEGNNPFIGDVVAVGADAKNLKPGTYAVVVTNEADGCQTVVSLSVGLDAEEPVVEGTVIANITDCDNLTAGSLEAFVSGENSNKYEFDWYIGDFADEAPDFNNQPILTNLSAGNYTVVAREKASGCPSLPLTLTVEDLTSIPVMATTLDLEQTSCDTANPNGAVSATADGVTTGYSFEWFSGQSTTILIGTGPSLTGLAAGFYTVRATNTSDPNSQNCAATAEVEVTENLVDPAPIDATVVDQSYCVNPNGAIAASVNGVTAGYTFYWFNGNIASPDINSPDFTGATYADLVAGDYTLIVENNATLCKTDAQAYTVANLTAKPVVALAASTELTSCAAPNGSFSVTADGGTSGHTFRWYEGVSTADADEIMTASGASISGLAAGTYTVLVSNTTTGCFDTFEHTVLDQTDTPAPTTTIIDQTQCTPLDGEIQANVGGSTSDYNFYWFNGNVASPDINSPDRTGATISDLPAGEYTLVVEHDASKCASAAQVLTVDDLTPSITGTINLVAAQTSCGAPNGELSVSATGGTSYTFEWFTGTDATGTSFASGASVAGLSSQTYTALVTAASGCSDTVSYELPSDIKYPTLNISSIDPNTICNPALATVTDYDGAITAAVDYDGAAGDVNEYQFNWFVGSDTSTPFVDGTNGSSAGMNGERIEELNSGDYTLVVFRDTPVGAPGYLCNSDTVTVNVPDNTTSPIATVNLVASQTSCDASTPNGSLNATALAGSINYEWFDASDASVGTGVSIAGLASGTYRLVVTDEGTGCVDTASYALPSNIIRPIIDIDPTTDITANTVCDPGLIFPGPGTYDGAITAAVDYDGAAGDVNEYQFNWFVGSDTSTPFVDGTNGNSAGTNGERIEELNSGDYTLVVFRDIPVGAPGYLCNSDTVTVNVPDNTTSPIATVNLVASQTSCDASTPNGSLNATALAGSINYEWFDASDASVGTGVSIAGLASGTYRLVVTDEGTGCVDTASYALPSNIIRPIIDIDPTTDITANTVCDPGLIFPGPGTYDGAITAAVDYDGAAGDVNEYQFNWFVGSDTSTPFVDGTNGNSAGTNGERIEELNSGDYTLVVFRDIPVGAPGYLCNSDTVTVNVPDNTTSPIATVNLVASQTSCDASTPNGSLNATALAGSINYEWFDASDASVGTGVSIAGLASGTYRLVVTDEGTGCVDTASYALPSNIIRPIIDIDPTTDISANTVCDPGLISPGPGTYDGAITAAVDYDGAAGDVNEYQFNWFVGSDTSTPFVDGTNGSSAGMNGERIEELNSGDYTLVVFRDTPVGAPGYLCNSDTVTVNVPDNTTSPIATVNLVASQTSCDASTPNGSLNATALAGSINYEWFDASDASVGTGVSIAGLASGTYRLVVTDEGTGCVDTASYALPSNIIRPIIDIDPTTDITANTVCDPGLISPGPGTYDGAITAAVDYDGAAGDVNEYQFNWFVGSDTSTPFVDGTNGNSAGTNGERIEELNSGDYTLVVFRDTPVGAPGYLCNSDTVTVNVPDNTTSPIATVNLVASQTSCDASTPNGSLNATALAGSINYEWFDASDASVGTGVSIAGLASGTYRLVVTDEGTGCVDTASYALPSNIIRPIIDIDPTTDITANTVCDPGLIFPGPGTYDGAITAAVDYDGAAGDVNEYQFNWFVGSDTSTPFVDGTNGNSAGTNGERIEELNSGDYTLVVFRDIPVGAPGYLCNSDTVTVTVTNDITKPTASIIKDALQTSCGSPNGRLTAAGATGSGTYSYEWFIGTNISIPFDDTLGGDGDIVGANNETIENIAAGNYAVRVTDLATGCQTVQDIYLNENIIDPALTLAVSTPMTDCTFDGVITPTITSANAAPSGHNFTWHAGQSTADPVIAVTTDAGAANPELSTVNTGTTIYSGYYTVVVTDIFTGCISSSETIFLDRPAPQFTLLTDVNVLPSTCGLKEGIVTAWVDLDGNANPSLAETNYLNYTFEWYRGNPVDLQANYYTNPETAFDSLALDIDESGIYPGSVPGSAGVVNVDYFGPDGATNSGATLFGRESGLYTVVVTDDATGCKEFIGVNIGFNNGAEVVVAEVDITNSTNCATPNGSLEVKDLDNIPAGQFFNEYDYNWYEGTNEDVGNEIVDGSGTIITTALLNQNGATAGLAPGYYTVVPYETFGSLCRLTPYTVFLDSAARQPVLAAAITESRSCVGNGQIALTATPNAPDTLAATTYSYLWSSGEASATISNKLAGDYTVTVTDDNTSCSVTKTYTILDQRVIPVISNITPVAQTFCNANGSLTIDATEITPGTPDEYTYQVFLNGKDAASEVTGSTTINATAGSVVFDDLVAGTYYIGATRNVGVAGQDAEGCTSAFIQEEVADELDLVLLSLSQTANTSCDPDPNSDATLTVEMSTPSPTPGILNATYTIDFTSVPTGASVSSFTTGAGPGPLSVTFPQVGTDLILPGTYEVMVTNDVSNCGITRNITVESRPEPIVFSRSDLAVLPQQLCNADGEISVSSISPGAVGQYTYTWYKGSVAVGNIVGGTGPTLNSGNHGTIASGIYYVVASRIAGNNPGSGCSSVAVRVEIPNEQVKPVLALSQTANTSCDPDPNSDATLTVEMSTPSPTPGILNATYTIDFTSVPTGASVSSFTTGAGPGPLSVTFPQVGTDLILPGTYEVMVTNDVSNCSITRNITVESRPEPIVFSRSDLAVLPQQLCNADGEISVSSISPGAVGQYTYTWYKGSVAVGNIVGGTGPTLNSGNHGTIASGIYYVVASRIAGNNPGSGCSSVAVRVEIPNEQVKPVLALSQTANTSCDPDPNSDATLTVEMSTPSPTPGILNATYTIDFTSVPTGASVSSFTTGAGPGPLSVTFPQVGTDLILPGTYEVMVTNDVSNCSITRNITVESRPEPIVFSRSDLAVLPQQLCNADGEISVSSISPGAVGQYTYTWYKGSVAVGNIVGGTGPTLNSGNHGTIASGIYYVVASRIAGNNPGSGCSSVAVRVEIPNEQVKPVLALSQTANTSCDPDPNSDATLTVEMSTPSPTPGILNATYTIDFTSVPTGASVSSFTTGAGPGPLSVTFPQVGTDLILPGTYEVMVTNDVSNCSITRNITVESRPEPIVFSRSDLAVLPQQLCNADGEISVSSISPGAVGQYTYTWYKGSVAVGNIVGGTGPTLNSGNHGTIASGIYYVVASRIAGNNPGSGCSSVAVRVEIPNEQVKPVLALSQTANTSCDPDPNSDATLTVEMSTPSPTPGILNATYTIDFTSVPTGASVSSFTTGAGPGPLSVTFPQVGTDLILPGTYEVMVTNDVSNCSITRNITVESRPEPIVFSRSDLAVLPQQLCNADGEISVSSISPGAVGQYTYTWYKGSVAVGNIVGGTGPTLNSGNHGTIASGIYYVVASRIAGNNPGSGCSSVAVRVEIPNEQVKPVLALSQTANTSCDPDPNSDATLTVEMSTPSPTPGILNATYTIDFTSVPTGASVSSFTTGAGPGPLSVTFPQVGTDLILPGTYEVMVTNDVSNCSITRNITVESRPEPIVFSRSDLAVLPQQLCNADGEISVSSISPGAVGQYTYTWYKGSVAVGNIVGGTGPTLNSGNHGTIASGIYYVVASRIAGNNPGSGCSSVAVRVEIPNEQVKPVLALSQTANTSCDPDPNSDATLTVEMSTPSPTPGILNATYTIDFTSVPTGASVSSFTTGAGPGPLSVTFPQVGTDLILPGTYEVMVTNDVSNCGITRNITVESRPEPIVFSRADLSVVNATSCSPSGSISVTNILPNTPNGISDYSFIWFDGEANYNNDVPIPGVSGPVLDSTAANYPTIHPGTYYVQAIRNTGVNPGSTCISNAVRVVIEDDSENPAVLIVENAPNSSCDPANPNGSISASVPGFATADYTFEWFIGLNNTTNAVAAANISGTFGETISNLPSGNYTLRITDNTSPGESCETIASFFLSEDLTINVPKNVTFDIVAQSDCFDSGSITVTSLTPGLPADFGYEWYYETYDGSGLIAGETSAALTGRPSGTYYVMITNIATQCALGAPIERVIPNQSTPPAIELRDGKPNTDCDITTPDGFLEVTADLGQTAGYSFVWYEGEMPVNSGAAVIGNSNRINQLDSGYYSVVVQSSATNCSDTAQFYVDFIPELPKISLTTSPVTNCGSPNGSAYAQIYNLDGNFAFNWYIGSTVGGQPDFTGDWLRDLPAGDYVVEAIDLDAPACISEPIAFTISELIEVPQLQLNQISPNTYCDPAKVNGVAEVAIYYVDDDDVTDTVFVTSNFEVLWYRTASMPGASVEYNGRINSTLSATEYTVTYMNMATNCQWEQNIVISEDLTVVPPPEVAITELFDSCEEPNGAAEITAATQNTNYIYKWYLNEIGDLADFETTNVNTLDLGTYLVTATDTVSGCVSEPTEVAIIDNREAPIITLTLTKETCGDFNGSATITLNEDYEYRVIEWDTPDGIATGTTYEAFTAGEYEVTVIGSNGCAYTKTFSISSEINVFNGFSPNGDGVNDEWEIGCIESFNGNKVEIYNRAGALVFATENYRNAGNGFKGLGNRGLYAGNRELPDGTYFYVIIKGDGSESVTGYIEMFR